MGLGEFGRIDRYLRPLAAGFAGALNLRDDAALLPAKPGFETVVTVDALIEGIHVPEYPPPALFAHKALRSNLSDLAAKGAIPWVYFLTLALPGRCDDDWLAAFTASLASDQHLYGIQLAGGDSVSTSGPAMISITAIGLVPTGTMVRRDGAQPGDIIYVTGWIGDGLLGLEKIRQGAILPDIGQEAFPPEERYWCPRPRLDAGQWLRGRAHAAADISDGLVADLENICLASGVSAQIWLDKIPLSPAAITAVRQDPVMLSRLVTAGDDYELVVTGPPGLDQAALAVNITLFPIGVVMASNSSGCFVDVYDSAGKKLMLIQKGWAHGDTG